MVLRSEGRGAVHRSLGALDSLLWNLLQTDSNRSETKMSDQILLGVAALVFTLMITGLFLTLRSAGNWQDPSQDKDGLQ